MIPQWSKYITWRDVALLLIGADLGSRVLRAVRAGADVLIEQISSGSGV